MLMPLRATFAGHRASEGAQLARMASDSWEIAPAEVRAVPPVILLPGQAERITRTEFAPRAMVMASLAGDPAERIAPTRGFLLRDAVLADGVLYAKGAALHLRAKTRRLPPLRRPPTVADGALYETWVGNRWFGNWLLDDALTYRLAEAEGAPVTTTPPRGGHVPRYEALLGMAPRRLPGPVRFARLIAFDDHANNAHRLARAQDMRARLLAGRRPAPVTGVFLLRGRSGDARVLTNEAEIARALEDALGFRTLFAEDHDVDALVEACGAARVIAGVEGSQLNHGIAVMPPGGTLLTLQPPDRATTAMKLLTDRWAQRFAMCVGIGGVDGFSIPPAEVVRTAELALNRQP